MLLENSLAYLEQQTDDVENLFAGDPCEDWEFEAVQLSPGPLGFRFSIARLPDLDIYWSLFKAGLHMREHHQHGAVYLTFLLDADGPAKWYGRDVEPNQALLYFPRHEQDYVLPRNSSALGFMISERLLRRMGWYLHQTPLHIVSRQDMQNIALQAADISTRIRTMGQLTTDETHVLQERLVTRLGELLQPWMDDREDEKQESLSPGRPYRLVEKALQRMQEWDFSRRLDIDAFAREMSASTRSLYRAFHTCLGVGPYEYFTLLRLKQLRSMIRKTGPERGAITDAAMTLGFDHLGRFSTLYRRHYGELPRDSLRRWSEEEVQIKETLI